MRPERRNRLALLGGAVALIAQSAITLWFVAVLGRYVRSVLPLFGGVSALSHRMSQLKPAPFKTPWSWLYFAAFLTLVIAAIGALCVAGVRRAIGARTRLPPAA